MSAVSLAHVKCARAIEWRKASQRLRVGTALWQKSGLAIARQRLSLTQVLLEAEWAGEPCPGKRRIQKRQVQARNIIIKGHSNIK